MTLETHSMDTVNLVLPCAGSGLRAGKDIPKQYAQIAGKPMIVHTLNALLQVDLIQSIALVVSPQDIWITQILENYSLHNHAKIKLLRNGGSSRAQSVLSGLKHFAEQSVANESWVLVHDAARCLIRPQWVNRLIDTCMTKGCGGLLAIKLPDTLKQEKNERVMQTIEREDKWLAQTPQMFKLGELINAITIALERDPKGLTDEASALEAMGQEPLLIKGNPINFKVTIPEDFEIAEVFLKHYALML
jgi:2-C-methyl-D-erythritol 4-phosphate cytidylyltransferase